MQFELVMMINGNWCRHVTPKCAAENEKQMSKRSVLFVHFGVAFLLKHFSILFSIFSPTNDWRRKQLKRPHAATFIYLYVRQHISTLEFTDTRRCIESVRWSSFKCDRNKIIWTIYVLEQIHFLFTYKELYFMVRCDVFCMCKNTFNCVNCLCCAC